MPYKCVHCSEVYEDGSKEILAGCAKCNRKFFFYIKKDKLELIKDKAPEEPLQEISAHEKNKIEQDIREIAGIEDEETPVFLDMESIKVIKEGKYLLDLTKLFSNKPRIYQLEDGKYIIDLSNLKTASL